MIKRERLKELIKQGKTIYSKNLNKDINLKNKCEIVERYHEDGVVREHILVYEPNGVIRSYLLSGLTEDKVIF